MAARRSMRRTPQCFAITKERTTRTGGESPPGRGRCRRVALWPRALRAQAAPRVVIVGGGFAGASCARALRRSRCTSRHYAGRGATHLHRTTAQQRRARRHSRPATSNSATIRSPQPASVSLRDRHRRRCASSQRNALNRKHAAVRQAGDRPRHRTPLRRAARL